MNLTDYLTARAQSGIRLLRDIHREITATTIEQFATDYGYRLAEVKQLQRTWDTFSHPKIQQAADEANLSLTTLRDIATVAWPLRRIKNKNEHLLQLCRLAAGQTADNAKNIATRYMRELTENTSRYAPDSARCHRAVGRDGKRRLVACFNEHTAARIDTILDAAARKLIKKTPKLAYDHAYATALHNAIVGNQHTPERFSPMFMIATDLRFHADGTIATTDGALANLKDVIDTELAPTGWAAVIATNDNNQPVVATLAQTHITDRFAGTDIRLKSIIETLVCAWPGCDTPAIQCQAHHIHPYYLGGPTTQDNITPLCHRHNGLNDDNPHKPPKNGRIERHPETGKVGLRRKPTAQLEYNEHPVTKKTTAAYARFIYDADDGETSQSAPAPS